VAVAARLGRLGQAQPIPVNGQRLIRGDDVNGICLDRHAICDFRDRHARMATNDGSQFALTRGVQMQHDDEGQSAIGRHCVEKAIESLNPACRGADADDWHASILRGGPCVD
jgi:hypothetical protein